MIIIRHTVDHFVLSDQNSSAFIVVCFVLNFRISKVKKGIIDSIFRKVNVIGMILLFSSSLPAGIRTARVSC